MCVGAWSILRSLISASMTRVGQLFMERPVMRCSDAK